MTGVCPYVGPQPTPVRPSTCRSASKPVLLATLGLGLNLAQLPTNAANPHDMPSPASGAPVHNRSKGATQGQGPVAIRAQRPTPRVRTNVNSSANPP